MEIASYIGSLIFLMGAALMFLGSLGLLRFPDVYTRLHGTGVASTGGLFLILLGVAVYFAPRSISISLLASLTLIFVLFLYPLATTAIIWAAHRTRVPIYYRTLVDELELYDPQELDSRAGALTEGEQGSNQC